MMAAAMGTAVASHLNRPRTNRHFTLSFRDCSKRFRSLQPEWQASDRAKWPQTAANVFDLIYKGEGGIAVRSATAHRSPRPD